MKKGLLLLLISISILVFISSCTNIDTINLNSTYENVTPNETLSGGKEAAPEITEGAVEANETETPVAVNEPAAVYVDPTNLVKKLCPEEVLLGLRKCKRLDDGNLNITIKNAGYENITIIFYLLYNDKELTYVYFNDPFMSKEEKTYTIDIDTIENQYGEIEKIMATPVLVKGLEALSCQNKKLPIIVSTGCN